MSRRRRTRKVSLVVIGSSLLLGGCSPTPTPPPPPPPRNPAGFPFDRGQPVVAAPSDEQLAALLAASTVGAGASGPLPPLALLGMSLAPPPAAGPPGSQVRPAHHSHASGRPGYVHPAYRHGYYRYFGSSSVRPSTPSMPVSRAGGFGMSGRGAAT